MDARNYEDNLTRDFVNNSENTINVVISNSVGMALLKIKRDLFGDTPDDRTIEKACSDCLNELEKIKNTTKNETTKQSLEYIIGKAQEKIDPILDVLELYIQTEAGLQSQRYVFPFKEVLMLVWKATNDSAKFTFNYAGTPQEKLNLAQADLLERQNTFLKYLESIYDNRICHQGSRNDLVFTLNETYEGINLIEDGRSTILAFLRDNTFKLFWQTFENEKISKEEKQLLIDALLAWMQDSNPEKILKIIDADKSIPKKLKELFIQHGIDPKVIALDKLIDEALPVIGFACDPKCYPELAMVNEILNPPININDAEASAAIKKMQEWIMSNYRIENKDNDLIVNFYRHFKAINNLKIHRQILSLSGKMSDEFVGLEKTCVSYFKAFNEEAALPVLSNDTLKIMQEVDIAIEHCKKDMMVDEIENFFHHWYPKWYKEEFSPLRRLYSMVLDKNIRAKIILTDKEIEDILKANSIPNNANATVECEITPYHINRVFLHAFLVQPEDWTPLFANTLSQVLEFVEKDFNQSNVGVAADLKRDSYPFGLLDQLKYLLEYKMADTDEKKMEISFYYFRPKILVLPEHIKYGEDWWDVSQLLDNEKRNQIYRALASGINKVLVATVKEELRGGMGLTAFKKSLRSIPQDGWKSFLSVDKDLINFVCRGDDSVLVAVLYVLPSESRFYFLTILDKNWLEKVFQGVLYRFISIMATLPVSNRLPFMDMVGLDKIEELIRTCPEVFYGAHKVTPSQGLLDLIQLLSHDHVISFLEKIKLSKIINTKKELSSFLSIINPSFWQSFLNIIGEDALKALILDICKLNYILMTLPKNNVMNFINALGMPFIKKIVCKKYQADLILNQIPTEHKESFLKDLELVNDQNVESVEEKNKELPVAQENLKELLLEEKIEDKNKITAIKKIEVFAEQLENEYKKKRRYLWIFCPHTKENKAARLRKLAENLKDDSKNNWKLLVEEAKKFEDDHPLQNILSHRTQNLLQNIIDDHSEKGILGPEDSELEWNGPTPKFW